MPIIENFNFNHQKVFVRVDFNVPLNENFEIMDDTRIRSAMPTFNKILTDGGSIIIGSHLGRPTKASKQYSLQNLLPQISKLLNRKINFVNDCLGKSAIEKTKVLKPGEVLLLENLRFYSYEEGTPRNIPKNISEEEKNNIQKNEKNLQKKMAKQLASYASVYVNDAFGSAHRDHASTSIMANYFDINHKLFGYLMQKEIDSIEKVLKNTNHPFTAIMGGSKISSKIEIIENLLSKVDNLIIAGGMTFTFIKALGGQIGNSIYEKDKLDLALSLIQKAKNNKVNLVLATDSKIADHFSNEANTKVVPIDKIPDGWEGLDIGTKTKKIFSEIIEESKTILWNGPVGVFEFSNFMDGSRSIGESIVYATKKGAFSLIGGGDSIACVNKLNIANHVSYVSTGGGALLEFIEGKQLPGIKAIRGF